MEKHINLSLSDNVKIREALKSTVKDVTRRSKEKVRRESFCGFQLRKSHGDLVYKERAFDRDTDYYRELVQEESGEIVHYEEGKLSDHIDHGSAKFKPKKGLIKMEMISN